MQGNYAQALARVLVYEGGLSNNPADPGGLTNKGITQTTYNNWRAKNREVQASVKDITDAEVSAIYKTEYWDRVYADNMPNGVDFCLFDAAVNSGVGSAASWAQAVVGITVDGDFGTKTKAAVQGDDPDDFIRDFCSRRLATLQRLPTWKTFGKGWSARIANVLKTALSMADGSDLPDAAVVSGVGGHMKANPATIPASRSSQTVATATTVGGAVATTVAQATQSLTSYSDIAWIKYGLMGLTIVGAVVSGVVLILKTWDDQAASSKARVTVNTDADAGLPTVAFEKTPPPPPATPVVAKPAVS